ncbi:MAG: arginyl-tRNA synthetase [Acidobacteria bacterium]|nr:arginyl-tRNA synthetase [Acidobacteriota bacterium]
MLTTIRRLLVPLTLGTALAVAMTGCVATGNPTASPTTTETPAASANATPTPSATPTPTATPVAIPITVGCTTLISLNTMYAFNPNYGLITSWKPAAGSAAAAAISESGVACRWSNQTSGITIDVSVAHLDAASIEALKNTAVEHGTLVPTYGDEAYFGVSGGVGTAVVFKGTYWLVATSPAFLEPGDPADLINSALSALK